MKVKSKKFSTVINEFTVLWLTWMKEYAKSINTSLTFKERRMAGEKCGRLIKKRYEKINELNKYFNEHHRIKN